MNTSQEKQSYSREGEATCELHGTYIATFHHWSFDPPGKEINATLCPKCEEDREQRQRERIIFDRRQKAAIPKRFQECNFDNYVTTTPQQKLALSTARSYAENFEQVQERGDNLIFCGAMGNGKTHLSAAIINDLILYVPWGSTPPLYTTLHEMIRAIRGTWGRDADETETEVERYRNADLLVVDEIGVSLGGEAERNQLFDVLDGRYRDVKPTVIISNLSEKELRECLGTRIFDRLTEIGSTVVRFTWKSWRQSGQPQKETLRPVRCSEATTELQAESNQQAATPSPEQGPGQWVYDPDSDQKVWISASEAEEARVNEKKPGFHTLTVKGEPREH